MRTGKDLFKPLSQAGRLPREVVQKLPSNYGIRVTRPENFRATPSNPRLGYASGYGQNGWLLAPNSVVECIDNFEKCLADTTGEFSKHYRGNDIFFVNEPKDVELFLMWWVDAPRREEWDGALDQEADLSSLHSNFHSRRLIDVSITNGVIDEFIVGDFMNIGVTGPFSGNGRYIHGRCTDPRPGGRVNMVIETN